MVGEHVERTAFSEVAETFDSLEDGEEFSVVRSVFGLGFVELLREEGDWFPDVIDKRLNDGSSTSVRDHCRYGDLRVIGRKGQHDGIAEGLLSSDEGCVSVCCPR